MSEPSANEYTADLIRVISPTIAEVRKRPGMFFGSVGVRGVEQFVYELVANVLDCFLAGRATFVNVTLEGAMISVEDDGDGLPFDEPSEIEGVSLATEFLTQYHMTNSRDGHAPHVHLTTAGIGLAPLNAASTNFTVRSWRNEQLWEQCFDRGIDRCDARIIDRGNGRGTKIEVTPDPELFRKSQPRAEVIRRHLFETAHLFSGLKVGFNEERFYAPQGLKMLGFLLVDRIDPLYHRVDIEIERQSVPSYHIALKAEDIFVEVAVFAKNQWDTKSTLPNRICSWVNGARTPEHGSHVEGLRQAVQIANLKPSLCLIHVVMHAPQFAGPVRYKLNVPHLRQVVRNILQTPLQEFRDRCADTFDRTNG